MDSREACGRVQTTDGNGLGKTEKRERHLLMPLYGDDTSGTPEHWRWENKGPIFAQGFVCKSQVIL